MNGAPTSDSAILTNKFITFNITPNAGYRMSLSSVNPFIIRVSSTAPINVLIQYQVATGPYINIATRSITRPSSTSNFTLASIDLSSISDFQNIAPNTTITFRIVPYSSSSSSGAWYIGNQSNVNSLVVNGTISVGCSNPLIYNVTGGGSYCSGGIAPNVGIDNSQSGVNYQLKKDGNNVGSAVPGTGSALSFGTQPAAGTYTVVATNVSCSSTMNGSATVIVNSCGVPTLSNSILSDFGNICINTTAGPNSFNIDGSNLDGSNISIAALPGFSYAETVNGTYTNTLGFSYTGSNFTAKTIYLKFTPTAVQSYNGNIQISGGGVSSYNVAATGTGVNTAPSVTNGNSSAITATTATLTDSIIVIGCSPISSYGFEYSLNSGFPNGSGTQVFSSNVNNGIISATVTGLMPNQQYYYKAFATNGGGTTYASQRSFINAPLAIPMASQPGQSFTEDFHDIANWSSFFIIGAGANHFDGLSANATGTIPDGIKITASTNSFTTGSSGGVQKGTDQAPSTQSIVLLSTGSSPENSTSSAIDFYLDFTGVNAGTLSFDWASVNNSTGDRKGSLRIYGGTNGTTFTEIPAADVLNFTNNSPTSGSVSNITLPASFNNNANARLRFYYANGTGGTTGSRPKISIDNLTVTAVPSIPCNTPTAQPSSMVFGTITDVSIQGSFAAANPAASDQYVTIVTTGSSLTSNPVDGTTYNVGDALGDGTVIAKGSTLNFTASNLSPSSTYNFFTFALNGVCTGGPKYLTEAPLTNSAVTNSALPPCSAQSSQPANLLFGNIGINTVSASFTGTAADEYLVLVSTASSLSNTPVNGVAYAAGDVIGNATVVQRNSGTSFTASALNAGTQYYFYVFSINSKNCINGPVYNVATPLTASQTTQPLPPCVRPASQPTLLSLNAANTSISGTFNSSSSADDYLIIKSTSAALSATPQNNTDYAVGASLGGGVVVANSSSTSFLSNNLSTGTAYYFFVFAANKNCSGGTKYLTASPLIGNITTTNAIVNNYYFGTLHSHSDYSDGNQDHPGYTPTDDYNYAITAQCMDFLGISEHNHFSSPDNPGNTIDNFHKGPIEANNFTAAHPNFLALYGMEWGVISGGGHVVVYGDGMDKLFGWESGNGGWGTTDNYDVYVPKSTYTGPVGLFKTVNDFKDQNTFATLAHPNQTDFNDLADINYDAAADSAIVGSAVESGPATTTNKTYSNPGSSMYYLWYYQTLLSKGYHLGPTIDHDNHNTTFGHTTYSRTAVIAPALTKTDLIKAMHDMHFYATQDCDSKVDFTINTKIMGSVFSGRNAPAISVTLSDLTTNTSSAIIRVMYGQPGSKVLPVKIDSVIGNTLYFVDDNLANGTTGYYYIDITNGTSRIVTSPIWYTRTCSVSSDTTVYACGSYQWSTRTYSESGTYSISGLKSVSGCDSTATLHLTITTPTAGDTTAVACNSFTWYATTYTSSGTPTHVLKERGGCDSTVTLHLTINYSSEPTSFDISGCTSLMLPWSETVTISGDYSHTYTNVNGCDSVITAHVTINQIPAVSITPGGPTTFCPDGSVDLTATSAAGYLWSNSASTQTITVNQTGNYSVTITDANGCSNTSEPVTITVQDITPPEVHTQNITVALGTDGTVTIMPSQINNGSTDNCAITENGYSLDKTAFDCTHVGDNQVTLTVLDANGNTATGTATVTIIDDRKPTIIAPGNVSISTDNESCSATNVALGTPATTDNCRVASVINDHPSSTYAEGTTTVIWTVTDSQGNTTTATQTVTATDNQSPVITTTGNQSVNVDLGKCGAVVSVSATAMDNCGVGSPTGIRSDNLSLSDEYPVGSTMITWSVTDIHGNTGSATQIVTVTDNQSPVITTNGDKNVNADQGRCGALVSVSATAMDNCGVGLPSGTRSDNLSLTDEYPVGTTTVTWTVTDIHNNSTTATQIVTVIDDQNPTITAPIDITVNADNGKCYATNVALGTPTYADNCGANTPTNNALSQFPVGLTTVTWTVTDTHGHSTTATQIVTVIDDQNPTITAPADVTVNADNGKCSATNVALGTPAYGDNCDANTPTNNAPSPFPVGTTTVTWIVTDTHGHSTTATQIVTVTDDQPPVITTNGNKSVNADQGHCGAIVSVSTTATDNCSVGLPAGARSDNLSLTAEYPVGTTTITWSVADIHGNTASATQTVTVTDNEAPTITCRPNQLRLVNNTGCSYKVAGNEFDPTAFNDNCPGFSLKNNFNNSSTLAGAIFPKGSTTVTWTVTDVHNHSTTCTTAITINSTLAISIQDVYAVQPGGAANTLYIGYGPSSVTLNAAVSGGAAPYTYKWTIGSSAGQALKTTASYTVSPTATTTYYLNVKDVYGCTVAFTTKTIQVVDVRCGTKVTVCVYSKGKYTTTCVTSSSVSGYLSNGSYLGMCNTPLVTSAAKINEAVANPKLLQAQIPVFQVVVSPNPSTTNFKLQVNSNSNQLINIRVIDAAGKVITTLNSVHNNSYITLGANYRSGTYFAEVTQGIHRKTIKLIKIY
jgi:hypothetical protein